MVALILNRLPLSYDPDDWRAASLATGYVAVCWTVWIIGVGLVILGAARILSMIDD
jgi:hypothetical protein